MVLNGLVAVYYNVIIAKALYYIFGSFTVELPWANCGHDWNTDECSDTSPRSSSEKELFYVLKVSPTAEWSLR